MRGSIKPRKKRGNKTTDFSAAVVDEKETVTLDVSFLNDDAAALIELEKIFGQAMRAVLPVNWYL